MIGYSIYTGGTENSKVGVGGDSAGGTMTASVTHDVSVDFQVVPYHSVKTSAK